MIAITLTPDRAEELDLVRITEIRVEPYVDIINAQPWSFGRRAEGERFIALVFGALGTQQQPTTILEVEPIMPGQPLVGIRVVFNRRDLDHQSIRIGRNPVLYVIREDGLCACGCGATPSPGRDFLPGHDTRALRDRISAYFGGSTLTAINELDRMFGGVGLHSDPEHAANHARSLRLRASKMVIGPESEALLREADALAPDVQGEAL